MSVKRRARGRQPQTIRINMENKVIDSTLTNGVLDDRTSVLERVRTLHAHAALLRSRLNKGSPQKRHLQARIVTTSILGMNRVVSIPQSHSLKSQNCFVVIYLLLIGLQPGTSDEIYKTQQNNDIQLIPREWPDLSESGASAVGLFCREVSLCFRETKCSRGCASSASVRAPGSNRRSSI
jgi:hypothetical protein